MKTTARYFFTISLCLVFIGMNGQTPGDTTDLTFSEKPQTETLNTQDSSVSFWSSYIFEPLRLSLTHGVSWKVKAPTRLMTNRSAIRLEYSKFFLNNFFIQIDTKLIGYWGNDHQAIPTGKDILFKSRTREAFLQASFGGTSIKAGIQCLIWGETDIIDITDVVSPRNYSELFFMPLDESRLGQPMITIDQFSSIGDWSCFFIPSPAYTEVPEKGTAYYSDMLDVEAPSRKIDVENFEYGIRWKKTFGRSDINIMAARLTDNDYLIKLQRSNMFGMTFNYAIWKFLLKGETSIKSPRAFMAIDKNTQENKILLRDYIGSSLALEYSPGGTFSASVEGLNFHVVNWNNEIKDSPKDYYTVVLKLGDKFFNEDLSVNWMTYYMTTYMFVLNNLTLSYKWNDRLNLSLSAYIPSSNDERNIYFRYLDQKQVGFEIQYQF